MLSGQKRDVTRLNLLSGHQYEISDMIVAVTRLSLLSGWQSLGLKRAERLLELWFKCSMRFSTKIIILYIFVRGFHSELI